MLVGAPCALLRLRRLSSNDSLPGWPQDDRRLQQWVSALVSARYGETAPHYLAEIQGVLPATEKQEHDREQLLGRIREDIERVATEVEARARESARFGGARGWPLIGPVARVLSNPRPPVGVSLVTSIIVALVGYWLVETHPFSSGARSLRGLSPLCWLNLKCVNFVPIAQDGLKSNSVLVSWLAW